MTTFNDHECLETKQGKFTTTQRSKLKQVYCFKVRQEHKQIKLNLRAKHSMNLLYCLYCKMYKNIYLTNYHFLRE